MPTTDLTQDLTLEHVTFTATEVRKIREDVNAMLTFLTELREVLTQVAPMLAMIAPGLKIPGLDAVPR